MTITDKLSTYYAKSTEIGYIPSSVGISDEEFEEYEKALRDLASDLQLEFTTKPTKLSYKGIELVKYGKKYTDSKIK